MFSPVGSMQFHFFFLGINPKHYLPETLTLFYGFSFHHTIILSHFQTQIFSWLFKSYINQQGKFYILYPHTWSLSENLIVHQQGSYKKTTQKHILNLMLNIMWFVVMFYTRHNVLCSYLCIEYTLCLFCSEHHLCFAVFSLFIINSQTRGGKCFLTLESTIFHSFGDFYFAPFSFKPHYFVVFGWIIFYY